MKHRSHALWSFGAVLVAGVWTVSACGEETAATDPGASTSSSGSPASSSSGDVTSSSGGSSGASSSGGSSGTTDSGTTPDPNATPPNFKVAFIGDTATGANFDEVLALIKAEKAQAVLVQGDVEYSGDKAADWLPVIDAELDTATTKIPYFVSRGNHDDDWDVATTGLGAQLKARLTKWGITPAHNDPTSNNYAVVYNGLSMVFVDESEDHGDRNAYVTARLANDKHYWKVCSWHKNRRDTNVGNKGNEMPWSVYDSCRAGGAFVAQGHSHTYSRSKTMVSDQALTVDTACADPFALCVGPGKHFFFDSSLGGVGKRLLEETNKPHWAAFDASDYGALFIEFHVDGDPKKARGYFKTVANVVIDPPASSGKTSFTITSTN